MLWVLYGLVSLKLMHLLYYAHFSHKQRNEPLELPPGPWPLPVLGSLHLLHKVPHEALARLAQKHGPLMHLRLGCRHAVFISNGTLAKEFLQASDQYFPSRPCFQFCRRLLYGHDNGVAFSIYGPRWRKMRRICTLELFTTKRIRSFQKVLEAELDLVVHDLNHLCSQQHDGGLELDIANLARLVVSNIMGRLVLSKRMCDTRVDGESLLEMFHKTNDAIAPAVGDFIPILGCLLDVNSRRKMDRVHKHIDGFWEAILEERRREREANPRDAPMDFLDVLLSNEEVKELGGDNLKATLMDILGAGSETSAITIEWAMAELLRSPQSLAKLQAELDKACPAINTSSLLRSMAPSSLSSSPPPPPSLPSSLLPWQMAQSSSSPPSLLSVTQSSPPLLPQSSPSPLSMAQSASMSSLSSLSSSSSSSMAHSHMAQANYLKDVVKETLRLHPPVPLLIPRASTGACCKVAGYTFAANTILFVNAWAIGRDHEVWENPELFWPERFQGCSDHGASMDLHNSFGLIPFGSGRRRCPGMGLGLSIIQLTLATLIRAFHWELPRGQAPALLDMSEKSGSAGTHKAQPLHAILRPRDGQKEI